MRKKSCQLVLVGNTIRMGLLTQMRNVEELDRERDVFADGDENEGKAVVIHSPPPRLPRTINLAVPVIAQRVLAVPVAAQYCSVVLDSEA